MKTRQWVEAFHAGKLIHDWSNLTVSNGKDTAILQVSSDAVRVKHPDGERIREAAGAHALQTLADLLDGIMLTARLYELRHAAATVPILPLTAPLIKHGGTVATVTSREASRAIDVEMRKVTGIAGEWIVSNLGKLFLKDSKCTDKKGVNHGFFVPKLLCRQVAKSKDFPHGWSWKGTSIGPCVVIPDCMIIQNRGAEHFFGPELDQDDYSQTALIVHRWCILNGSRVPTRELYTSKSLASLVTHDGNPFATERHPNVQQLIHEIAATIEKLEEVLPDTQPEVLLAYQDPSKSHGERRVEWMLEQLRKGIKEEPEGSNNGPQIRLYLKDCKRDGQIGFGEWLAKSGGNWCAASACYSETITRMVGDAPAVHVPRASGIEIESDAKKSGNWRSVKQVKEGFKLLPGDEVIYQRGQAGGWQRHVCVFIRWLDRARGLFETVGGNEGNRFNRATRKLDSVDLLGFVAMNGNREEPTHEVHAQVEPIQLAAAEAASPKLDGDNVA